jgi:hypothetical protein
MTKRVTFSKQLKYVVCCIVFSYIHRTLTKASVHIRIFKKRNKKAADAKRPTVKTAWNYLRGGQIKLLNFCNSFFMWYIVDFFRVFFVFSYFFFDKIEPKRVALKVITSYLPTWTLIIHVSLFVLFRIFPDFILLFLDNF